MAALSKIEWTDSSWNPISGCTKISPGCKHCYAERMATRLQAMGQPNYANGFKLTLHEHMLEAPLTWTKPTVVFVCSMSDLFHKDVPFEYIERVFDVMTQAKQHQFQVLTKRSERLLELSRNLPLADNIWLGVSVENSDYLCRIKHLKKTKARIKFISFEPLLGPLPWLNLNGITWAIVGGESGPGARPMEYSWVTSIRDQCEVQNVKFFFKQWGGVNKKKTGRKLDGKIYDQMPVRFDGRKKALVPVA